MEAPKIPSIEMEVSGLTEEEFKKDQTKGEWVKLSDDTLDFDPKVPIYLDSVLIIENEEEIIEAVIEKRREYKNYIDDHVHNVQKAWDIVQEKCADMHFIQQKALRNKIDKNIKIHDKSKYSREEFEGYRQYFYPSKYERPNEGKFNEAWQHHLKFNLHHYENIKPPKYSPTTDRLNIYYLVEMVCDWVAMGMKFGGNARDYYEKNKDEINLHEIYVKFIYKIFDRIYP